VTLLQAPQRPAVRPQVRPSPGRRRRNPSNYVVLAALIVLAVVMLIPFVIVVFNALKTPQEYSAEGPLSVPHGVNLDGIKAFWDRVDYGEKLVNSVIISGAVAILGVILSILNAYALGIGRIAGRTWLLVLLLMANLAPQESLVYPLYFLSKQLGIYDTRYSVIIFFTVVQSAFGTYLLSSVLTSFPRPLLEAARLDGANRWQVLWRIVVPISRPTIIVLVVFNFIWTWNEFLIPLVMLISNENQTVSVALGVLQGQRLMDATMSSASALLGIIPTLVFFLIFQRTLARGITMGAIK
jgi:raffinose/stachyose/melibiose transport system permease protein